jgi:ankyrin repeat protein
MAKMLIEAKADVNKADEDSETPLYWAARGGYTEIVKMLIEAKVDVNKANKHGRTPLYWAAKKEHLDIMTLLLCGKPIGVKELEDLPADSEDLIKEYLRCKAPKKATSL